MDIIQKLTSLFADFPGIGPRQAKRFAYFLLTRNQSYIDELAGLISKIKQSVDTCQSCFRFFLKNSPDAQNQTICNICSNKNRDATLLTVVSRDVDFEHIEKTGAYNGLYFILGGSVPVLDQAPEKRVRIKELMSSIETRGKSGLKEVILAMNANSDGEHTGDYLKKMLEPLAAKHGFTISTLGRGLSTGTELEYSDSDTLKNALKNRQ